MEPSKKAFKGIFIRVKDISDDLRRYLELSTVYLKYTVGNYVNIYKHHNENTWACVEAYVDEINIVAKGIPIAKTSQDVFDFIFECDLET